MKIILYLFLFLISQIAYSQDYKDNLSSKFGVFVNPTFNIHSANFQKIPDCPSCSPGYRSGSGFGISFGLLYEYPLNNLFTLGVRGSYYNFSGLLKANEPTTIMVNGIPTPGAFEHSIDSKLSSIGIEPMIKITPANNFFINAGIHAGYMIGKNYSQKEEITQPIATGTFIDPITGQDSHSRTRNEFSGVLQSPATIYLAPFAGVSYQLPLDKNGKWFIEPEIYYFLGITKIVTDPIVNKWSVSSIRAGIAIKYSPVSSMKSNEEFKEYRKIDTIQIASDVLTETEVIIGKEITKNEVTENGNNIITNETIFRTDTLKIPIKVASSIIDINAFGVDNKGNEISDPKLIIEEHVANRLDPLLNYVFFDENSSVIPIRYVPLNSNEKNKFSVDSLYKNTTLEIYYNILNIIGERMLKYPKSVITLTGCNANLGAEQDNKELSGKRAEAVKTYLVNIWKIDGSRIKIKSRDLPEKPSTPIDDPDKVQENRRVEITSDDSRIIAPVFIQNIQRTSNLDIKFKVNNIAVKDVYQWDLQAYQKSDYSQQFFENKGNANPPTSINWQIEKDQKITPKYEEPLNYQLTMIDNMGKKYNSMLKNIPVDILTISEKRAQRKDDYEIEKYSLILFDFDKSDIAGNNKKIIDFIKGRIKPESIIEIKGYTDRTGEEDYNQKLSENRATNTKNFLNRKDAESVGIGKKELLYNNDIPEGRFYCRTVEITVKTKVK